MDGKPSVFNPVYHQGGYCPLCGQPWAYALAKGAQLAAKALKGKKDAPQAQTGSSWGTAAPSGGSAASGSSSVLPPAAVSETQDIRQQPAPTAETAQPAPLTMEGTEYLNGFLRTQIGKNVLVQFLLGSNTFTDKAGRLLAVGANYILLQEANSDDLLVCDFFNIRFVTIYQ